MLPISDNIAQLVSKPKESKAHVWNQKQPVSRYSRYLSRVFFSDFMKQWLHRLGSRGNAPGGVWAKPQREGGQGAVPPQKNFHFQVENMIGKQYRDNSSLKFGMLQGLNIQGCLQLQDEQLQQLSPPQQISVRIPELLKNPRGSPAEQLPTSDWVQLQSTSSDNNWSAQVYFWL